MQINPEQAREEFRASVSKDGGTGVKDFMDSVGLGGWVGEVMIVFIKLFTVLYDIHAVLHPTRSASLEG